MDFEKKNNIYKTIMIIIVTALVTFLITAVVMDNYYFKTENGLTKRLLTTETNNIDTKIQLIREYLDNSYLGEITDEEKLSEYAVKGYVAGLGDEYTEYLTKEEYEELMVDVNGNYVGIGIYMTQDRYNNILVLLPIKGSPAEEAGIKTGDIITKVDGEDCASMDDLSLVANKVKGEEGTTVNLEILRGNEVLNKTIERKTVEINPIESEILENNIGYIQILSFDEGCSQKFENKLDELLQKNIKSLIIDLRDNGGGLVTEAVSISDLFIPKDKTIMIEIDKEKEEETKAKTDAKVQDNFNITILANENSASASEIFIGALKANGIAKVVGTKTFGKGVMQEIVPVSSGGALKLTIEEFRMPNGDVINKKGIEPDVLVEDNEETEVDEQLQKAIELLVNIQ